MRLTFRQGILKRPTTCLQGIGTNVLIHTSSGPIVVTLSDHTAEYYHTEPHTPNSYVAWTNITVGVTNWLYFDINKSTAERTFGQTLLSPVSGAIAPTNPSVDQHWFDTNAMTMKVWSGTIWVEYIRVFLATTNGSNAFTYFNFGSQVGVETSYESGQILFDGFGKVLSQSNGTFLTSNDKFFINGSSIHAASLESTILSAIAAEHIPSFSVVTYSSFGQIALARYEDISNSVLAFVSENVLQGNASNILFQGVVTNPAWNWPNVNTPLWVDNYGQLVAVDPHQTNPLRNKSVPIARVVAPDTIIFQQGLGGLGEQGPPGNASASTALATTASYGIVRLATGPTVSTDPLVVGDNDPRLTNARTPTAHTHPATDVSYIGHAGLLSGSVQTVIDNLDANKFNISGGTLTGPLTLSANPTTTLQAATKQYVDNQLGALAQPAGQVIYGTGTSITSLRQFSVNMATGNFSFSPVQTVSPGDISLQSSSADTTNPADSYVGGNIFLTAGDSSGNQQGGEIDIFAGVGGPAYDAINLVGSKGGPIRIEAGTGGATGGDGGDLLLTAGSASILAPVGAAAAPPPGPTGVPANGGAVTISSGSGFNGGYGGPIGIVANSGGTTGNGGTINMNAGIGGSSGGVGGGITVQAGNSQAGSQAGTITIQAGDDLSASTYGVGGSVIIHAGISSAGTLGDIILRTGNNPGSTWENLRIDGHGTWNLAGQSGILGQVLTSNGTGAAPTWSLVDLSSRVNKSGDTMLGALTLAGDPVNPLEATTKQYVDTHVYDIPYDISFFIAGNMTTANTLVGSFLSPRSVFVNPVATAPIGVCKVAPTASVTYTLKLNGASIGTISFNANATLITYSISSSFTIVRGDLLELYTPSVVEPNIKDVTIVITGCAPATPCSMVWLV